MNWTITAAVCGATLFLALTAFGESAKAPGPAEDSLANANNHFAIDLYHQIDPAQGNLFLSPVSISSAFAMAYAGARGATAEQMAKVLHFDAPADKVGERFAELLKTWKKASPEGGYQLDLANAFWGQEGYPFEPAFDQLLEKDFAAALHPMDFKAAEASRMTINHWVAEQTQGKITDLIPPDAITAATSLVLTNAVYFKAAWDDPFEPRATRDNPFTLADGKSVQAPMMTQTARFGYLKQAGLSILEMGYAKDRFSMIVFLPDRPDGLAAFEKSLTADQFSGWIAQLKAAGKQEVRVVLPKFKMTRELQLGDVLSKMGMPLAFSAQGDFSGINGGKEPLHIDAAIHKAYVDVNESGTEAAAATGITMRATAMRRAPVMFVADHPFFFVIRDNPSGNVLFMGRASDPTK